MNNMTTITILWSIALLSISIATLIYSGSNIAGIKLPVFYVNLINIILH